MNLTVCAYTSVCEEDDIWIPQYLKEAERLSLPFCMHFDRCSNETKNKVINHPLCMGFTFQDIMSREFTEQHKQDVFDLVISKGYQWGMAWDIDETYEKTAPDKLKLLKEKEEDYLVSSWLNLWEDQYHIRMDGPFQGSRRVKFYRFDRGIKWDFTHPITNGAKATNRKTTGVTMGDSDIICLHWGLMTLELRKQHKERWDRVYGNAVGSNPYGVWNYVLDEINYPPLIIDLPEGV